MLERGGGELGQSRQHVFANGFTGWFGVDIMHALGLIKDIIRFHFETKIYTFSLHNHVDFRSHVVDP